MPWSFEKFVISIVCPVKGKFVFSILRIVAHCLALASGYIITNYLVKCSNKQFLWNFFEHLLDEKLTVDDVVGNIGEEAKQSKIRSFPWKGISLVFTCSSE